MHCESVKSLLPNQETLFFGSGSLLLARIGAHLHCFAFLVGRGNIIVSEKMIGACYKGQDAGPVSGKLKVWISWGTERLEKL
jgi:hypothetical protein